MFLVLRRREEILDCLVGCNLLPLLQKEAVLLRSSFMMYNVGTDE